MKRLFTLFAFGALVSCTRPGNQAHIDNSSARLSEIEMDTQDLKQSLKEVKKEHSAATARLSAYTQTLDTLQKGCADALALEEMATSAQVKAEESAKRAEEIVHLRAHISDTLRLVEQTQKKVQVLESHLQGYWSKIDGLLTLRREVAQLKEKLQGKGPGLTQSSVYTVENGDSIDFIARKFGVHPTALAQMNNLSDNSLKVGQKLHIPNSSN